MGNPGDPKPKFKYGDYVRQADNPNMVGEISFIGSYDAFIGGYRYKVLEPNGTRNFWNEGSMVKLTNKARTAVGRALTQYKKSLFK